MNDEAKPVRAFVSLEVGSVTLRKLIQFQAKLSGRFPDDWIRWTTPEQLHLTLKFLGNVAAAALKEMAASLQQACIGTPPFSLSAETLGAFPSLRNPRVIWIGIGANVDLLMALQKRIDQALGPYSQKEEARTFHPHLTLGRLRETAGRHARRAGEILQTTAIPAFGSWTVKEIHLMRSQLFPKGSIHSALGTCLLS